MFKILKIFLLVQFQVNTYVTAFHDAVILYSLAVNETLSEGYSLKNGSVITQRMWNRTFEGKKVCIAL